jgi:hypothetical protein
MIPADELAQSPKDSELAFVEFEHIMRAWLNSSNRVECMLT